MRARQGRSCTCGWRKYIAPERTVAWSAPDLNAGTHPSAGGETIALTDEGSFNRRWIVESQAGAFADMKRVTVRVIWTYQVPDTVDLVTYFRR